MYPPTFLGGGMACTNIPPPPPLFEDKITSNLTFLTVKLYIKKFQKIRSLAPLARTQMYSETLSLRFCQYTFLDIIHVKKGVE